MRRMAARAFIPVGVTITGFVALCCIILYSSLRADLMEQSAKEAESIARTIATSARHAMLTGDRETLAAIIANVGGQQGVTTLRIVNTNGEVTFSGNPGEVHHLPAKDSSCVSCHSAEGTRGAVKSEALARAGTPSMFSVTLPIINETACSAASCHAHPASQKVLGLLHVGLDRSPFEEALAKTKIKMILFSVMVMILTVGGVAVLLTRFLFAPLKKLAELTSTFSIRQLEEEFGRRGGEIAMIARNFLKLARNRPPHDRNREGKQ